MSHELGSPHEQQEWQHPWEKIEDVGAPPVEIVITADEERTSETAAEKVSDIGTTATNEIVEHQQAPVAGKVEHTPAPKEAAVEGEIVLGNKNRGSTQFFDQPLAEAKKVCIIGDASEARRVDYAVYQVAQTIVENADPRKGNGVIIAARFAPAPDTILMKPPEQTKTFTPVAVDTTSPEGLYSVLKGDQLAEAVAKAAGGDNERATTAYDYVLQRVTDALTTQSTDETTGVVTTTLPTLAQVRDGVRWLREMYIADVQEITREQRDAVKNCIPKTSQAQNQPFYEPLGQWLDKAVPKRVPDKPALTAEQQPDPTSDITLVNIAVKPAGHGLTAQAEKALLSHALVPLLAEQTPWGRPEAVILTDIDKASPDAIREIDQICRTQNIPLIVTVGAIPEQNLDIVQADVYAITKVNSVQANILATKVLGTTMREDPTSRTSNIGISEGTSTNTGGSENFKLGSGFAESSGTSSGVSDSTGTSSGLSETVTIGEGPKFRAAELSQIPQHRIAVVSSTGTSYGLYKIAERTREKDFPLAPPQRQLDVGDRMRGIGQQDSVKAIAPTSAPTAPAPANYGSLRSTPASHVQRGMEAQELRMAFYQATGRPARGKDFDRWCRQEWATEQQRNQQRGRKISTYEQWRIDNGLSKPRDRWE